MDRDFPRVVDLRTTDPLKKNESALHHQDAFKTEKPKPDQEFHGFLSLDSFAL